MKWVTFAVALAALVPLARWLRSHPSQLPKAWLLFGLMPYGINPQITPVDWAGWPGYVFGIQITGLDLLAIVFLTILPRARHPVPFRLVMGLYFVAVVLSVFQAQVPMAATFYAWQLARVFLVYVVVARASTDERFLLALLTGMTIGLCYQAVLTIWQRFGQGILQTGGSFGNQNLLGVASEFAIFPLFSLLLAGKKSWQTVVAPVAGLIIAVLTTSRAAVGLATAGLILVFVLSALRGWTPRKRSVAAAGVVVAILLSPIAINSFQKRFADNPLGDYDERAVFEKTASLVLADHPFGAGANNYVVVANSGNYMERAGVPWGGNQRQTIVHNVYWLTAAEIGYLGVLALALLLFRIATVAFRGAWATRNDPRGDVLLGLGVSVIILIIHSAIEWVFVLYPVQYIFAMVVGMIAGLSTQLGYWSRQDQNQRVPITSNNLRNVSAKILLSNFQRKGARSK